MTLEVGKYSAGFRQDQGGGCVVPGGEKVGYIGHTAVAGDIADAQGGRTDIAYVHGFIGDSGAYGKGPFPELGVIGGDVYVHYALAQGAIMDAEEGAVQITALSAAGREEFVPEGVIDDSDFHHAVQGETDTDPAAHEIADEIRCSVNGIDNEGVTAAYFVGRKAVLFT